MIKKVINQNTKFNKELINTIESKFVFSDKPINRFNFVEREHKVNVINKKDLIEIIKLKIIISNSKLSFLNLFF